MTTNTIESFDSAVITATTNVCTRKGRLGGIFVSTATASPTVTIYDEAAGGTTKKLVDTFIAVAGTYYKLPFRFNAGCNVVIAGTASLTVGFEGG